MRYSLEVGQAAELTLVAYEALALVQEFLPAETLEALQARFESTPLEAGDKRAFDLLTPGGLVRLLVFRWPQKNTAHARLSLAGALGMAIRKAKVQTVRLLLDDHLNADEASRFLAHLRLRTDVFDTYKSKKEAGTQTCYVEAPKASYALDAALAQADQRYQAIAWARTLGNEPANHMTPERLAEEAKAVLTPLGVEVKCYQGEALEALGMDAFMAVAKGSAEAPVFIEMRYLKAPDHADLCPVLVGKGLTYDSGGYSIKPTDGMLTMKADMCGAAAVMGALCALALSEAKVNVIAVVAACENMISGAAYKPGDILSSLAGKTIEINNTDAEGRLTLADAVAYADQRLGASHIIDICTLTGACVVALGEEITGVMTEDEALWDGLSAAVQASGDKIWRMPCDPDLFKGLSSEVADLKNTGPRWGGMMTAGLFVRAFAGEKPWMHLDIAGPSYQSKASDFYPEGATAVGVEYLADLIRRLHQKA